MQELTIDKEFEGLLPPLTAEQFNLLETGITAQGCLQPIIVWANHEDTILDGHNRYRICTRFDIPFKTKALKFESREDVIAWIKQHARGQRNMTEEQLSDLRGAEYEREKKPPGHPQLPHGGEVSDGPTRKKLAKKHGVGASTIDRDAKFHKALNTIAETCGAPAKEKILMGESGLTKSQVVKAATLPAKKMQAAIKNGKLPSGSEGRPIVRNPVVEAMQFARMAIEDLKRITPEDPEREKAFCHVEKWINSQRSMS